MSAVGFVSTRYILARSSKSRLFIAFAFIAIALSVAALIVVMSVMNGFREDLTGRIMGLNGHISIYGQSDALEASSVREAIRGVEEVESVRLVREAQALVRSPAGMSPLFIRSVTTRDMVSERRLREAVVGGTVEFLPDGGVAIGYLLAEKFGLDLGDKLPVIIPDGTVTPVGVFPKTVELTVEAIFQLGMYYVDAMLAFIDSGQENEVFGLSVSTRLDVMTSRADEAKSVATAIEEILSSDFLIRTWQEEHAGLVGALAVERNVMFVILSLIVLVAALNIVSGMTSMVRERRQDIALMQVMGLDRIDVLTIFLRVGALIGFSGVIVGVVIGVPLALNIGVLKDVVELVSGAEIFPAQVYLFDKLPSKVEPLEVAAIAVGVFTATLAAALPSAWRATMVEPAEALRNA